MQWVGANSFRTSHYPYAEEWLDFADERGVLVISENPFVGLGPRLYKQSVLQRALPVVEAHVRRDRNHPCVVMWSLANEPNGPGPVQGEEEERPASPEETEACMVFFRALVGLTRSLDPARPLTYAMHLDPDSNPMAVLFDVLCVNKYYGWYEWTGRIEDSLVDFVLDVESFHKAFGKPVLLAEFGADAVAGVHQLPEVMFSEEFQSKIVELQYTRLLDRPWFLGAHVWSFADFRVSQSITRMVHNRKGVFTRAREPKLVAHTLRRLWRPAGPSENRRPAFCGVSVTQPFLDSSGTCHPGTVRWTAPATEHEAGAVLTAGGQWRKRKSALWRTNSGLSRIQQLAEVESQGL
ncbi:unnamed protein product [Prorocentrum cordatum]|uniref:Glycoside hydrolase family 2 catalytic domain-containing protein n=1 Tax=Prorocentrum cordatum TaxID=2364126 RepID=A0ABN9QEB5_9DINO|nr:unnamed protein product [Polarella glacialis]